MPALTLERQVGSLRFQNPLVYGGGTLKTLADVLKMSQSAASGGEIGTILPHANPGNTGHKLFYAEWCGLKLVATLNSLGMPGPGKENVSQWAKQAIAIAHGHGKRLGINVAASNVKELVAMIVWAVNLGFDWVTINGGCPNEYEEINGILVPKSILSYDTLALIEMVTMLDVALEGCGVEINWKPSPNNDTVVTDVTNIRTISESRVITGWISNNTIPHGFMVDIEGKPVIDVAGGLAGIGGSDANKMKAMGDIVRMKRLLPGRFNHIGAGGVRDGRDITDFLHAGAEIVMFASMHWATDFDFRLPGRMLEQFCEINNIDFD